jgi:hypothetical protein
VTIIRANASKPAITLNDVNTASGTPIRRLKPGTYEAIWTWGDFNGDSHTIATSFVEEPANASSVASSAPAKRTVNCPLARPTHACDVRYARLHATGTFQRLIRGAGQSASLTELSFTSNLDLALPG